MSLPWGRPEDTSAAADRVQFDLWRRMPAWKKAHLLDEICKAAEELARRGLRERHPEASEEELRLRIAALHLDRRTMIEVFHWDPLEH